MVKAEALTKSFGKTDVLRNLTCEIRDGTIYGLIGANGAGKSTTLNTVSGLLRSKTGDIKFLDSSITKTSPNKIVSQGLVMVPEGRRIFLGLTVEENLEMGAYTRPKSEIKASMEQVYELFPRLRERRTQIGGTLSGGEQQMLAMGRALMAKPKLIMLDEPSMGLAPLLVDLIFEIIADLHKAGSTILLVEQNAQAALSIADRAYVLETGKIVKTGRGSDLISDPDIKKAYLGA